MQTVLIIISVALVGVSALAFWLYRSKLLILSKLNQISGDRNQLETANASHLATIDELRAENTDLKTQVAGIEAREQANQKQFETALKQSEDRFKALAGETLKESSGELLKQTEAKLAPFGKQLEEYRKLLRDIEDKRGKAYTQLTEQVGSLSSGQQELRSETANLVRALRKPEGRGRWGELQMERLFELAGMTERVDYDAQAVVDAADGKQLKPDFTIHLPNDRVIVVDVKTPLDAYLDAAEETDLDKRSALLDRHSKNIKSMATDLSRKGYWEACKGSPEFVVMFIPGEAMLYAAVQRDPDLIERAMADNVIIATPTLLLALLKTVALGWREQSISENARKISLAGIELYDRLRVMLEHVVKLGTTINKTGEQYDKLARSIQTKILPQARRFEELESIGTNNAPKDVPKLELNTKSLDIPELNQQES